MPVSEPIDWSAVKDEMRAILIYLAKQRKTICYSDLAALISTARLHHRAPIFHRLLDEMSREDAAEGCRASLRWLCARTRESPDRATS